MAFRVALAAWTTGVFSLGQASWDLVISILGGFAVGIVTAAVNRGLQKLLLSVRATDIASELILELSLPLTDLLYRRRDPCIRDYCGCRGWDPKG